MTRLSDERALERIKAIANCSQVAPSLVADLAQELAGSGETIECKGPTGDVASTGGPSSLSTLICPLVLRYLGYVVPKLGVPGRPAGGIDCLAQLSGYRADLSKPSVESVLNSVGYAHFLAGPHFAPMDAQFFRVRQEFGFQRVPALVASSLLAKKVAAGVQLAGLEIRVSKEGNFGTTFASAAENGRLFEQAAALLGIRGVACATDGQVPYQPYIGRGEALLALRRLFDGSACPWLVEHFQLCSSLAVSTTKLDTTSTATSRKLLKVFEENITAQGSTVGAFERLTDSIERSHREGKRIVASRQGRLTCDLGEIRDALVLAQKQESGQFPDPAGVILNKRPGDRISSGEVIATLRAEHSHDELVDRITVALAIEPDEMVTT